MSKEEFITKLTELMDTDATLDMATKLADVEDWDSLSMVSFFSFCNAALKKQIAADKIKSAQTVEDLFKLVND
ncbi:MAG: hypothetical protein K6G55_00635 [Selenomonadaceae bacterium]|nr:hypothetical protein [Selenomonadaceae bacterium]